MEREIDMEQLYRTYYMEVYSFVMTLVKDASLTEEITQETFFKAMKSKFRGESGEFTWLCAIAKNLCADHFRKQSKRGELPEDAPSHESVPKAVEDKLMTLQIHQVLHQMEEPYKEVFSLRVFGELSFAQIGQIFEKTENWARVTYHRARLKIQDKLR